MKEWIDDIVAYDELDASRRRALQNAMQRDEGLRAAFQEWLVFRNALQTRIDAGIPPRDLLVAYVMEQEDLGDVLTSQEREQLSLARPALDEAVSSVFVVQAIVQRVREDIATFDEAWEAHTVPAPGTPVSAEDRPPMRLVTRSSARWVWRVAAAFLVGAFAVVSFLMIQRDAAYTTVATAAGETQEIELADGSLVRLFENSTLRYLPAESATRFNRQAAMSGKAVFEIVPDETSFRVEAGNAHITVLGTTFAVDANAEETAVVLASGSVAVSNRAAPHQQVRLEPGEKSTVRGEFAPSVPERVNLAEELAWTGQFVFRAERLDNIAARLSDFYGVTIAVPASLANERVTGTFDQRRPVHEILRTISSTLGVTVRHDGANRYVFAPR